MDFILKGKIKMLTQTFGVIQAIDYDETHFFQMIDVSKNHRSNLRKDLLVSYELKPNKRGKNEATNITILNIAQKQKNVDLSLINYNDVISNEFFNLLLENYTNFETSKDELNEIIKLIVRDNVITEIEEKFLIEKANELNLDNDLINKANEYLNSNNPFLDNILKVIFKDELIKENELDFLFEKSQEYGFSKSFVNVRFWQHFMNFHKEFLLNNSSFSKLIKLWGFTRNFKLSFDIKDWIIMQMNIYKFKDFNKSIINCQDKLESVISELTSEKFTHFNFDELYKKINVISKKDILNQKQTKINKFSEISVKPENKQNSTHWNNDFVPNKHKSEFEEQILKCFDDPNLFSDTRIRYLDLALNNGKKNHKKIGDEFDKIVESLG
jgi:cold shock CspA family protein